MYAIVSPSPSRRGKTVSEGAVASGRFAVCSKIAYLAYSGSSGGAGLLVWVCFASRLGFRFRLAGLLFCATSWASLIAPIATSAAGTGWSAAQQIAFTNSRTKSRVLERFQMAKGAAEDSASPFVLPGPRDRLRHPFLHFVRAEAVGDGAGFFPFARTTEEHFGVPAEGSRRRVCRSPFCF